MSTAQNSSVNNLPDWDFLKRKDNRFPYAPSTEIGFLSWKRYSQLSLELTHGHLLDLSGQWYKWSEVCLFPLQTFLTNSPDRPSIIHLLLINQNEPLLVSVKEYLDCIQIRSPNLIQCGLSDSLLSDKDQPRKKRQLLLTLTSPWKC